MTTTWRQVWKRRSARRTEGRRPSRAIVFQPLIVGLMVLAAGCGYHLVGTSSFLPPGLEALYVEKFKNTTSRADMDQRLDEAVTREWVRRGRFRLMDSVEASDLALRGVITGLDVAPVTFDEQGRATEYQMTLRAEVRLFDVRTDEPQLLWEDKGFSRRTSYAVDVSAVDYFDRQIEAMDEVSQEFARALVTSVLEGF